MMRIITFRSALGAVLLAVSLTASAEINARALRDAAKRALNGRVTPGHQKFSYRPLE